MDGWMVYGWMVYGWMVYGWMVYGWIKLRVAVRMKSAVGEHHDGVAVVLQ